ncbi:MAG TPA: DUF202 domain-containing protein [Egibacteraceae bacterium]|nr:DUF202 domain-containing protein [Egibacteraceae bacterium]
MDDQGEPSHPDYRYTLANERTFLAWIRTALALDAAGLAAHQLLPEMAVRGGRELIAAALVTLGTAVAVAGYLRWKRVDGAMRAGQALPAGPMPVMLAGGIGLVSLVAMVLLFAA